MCDTQNKIKYVIRHLWYELSQDKIVQSTVVYKRVKNSIIKGSDNGELWKFKIFRKNICVINLRIKYPHYTIIADISLYLTGQCKEMIVKYMKTASHNVILSWYMLLSVSHKFAKKWVRNERTKRFRILTTNINIHC